MIALIARFFSRLRKPAPQWEDSVAASLMESAEARAGTRASEARELRQAAFAFLRVVR